MSDNPLFLGIINKKITPNNLSSLLVERWYTEIVGKHEKQVIFTETISSEQFIKQVKEVIGKKRTNCCIYICMHGKQFPRKNEPGKFDEYLKLNERNLIIDTQFSELINSLPIINKYLMLEVCHSGGLLNDVKCDYERNIPCNSTILSLCSKDEKCYYKQRVINEQLCTICYFTLAFEQSQINPLKEPVKALEVLKKFKGIPLHPKLILITN